MQDRWTNLKETTKQEATALDGVIAAWLRDRETAGKRIFCAAGCSNCCTLFVQATLVEALLVAAELDAPQAQKLERYVHHQRKCLADSGDFLTVLRQQRAAIGPCPFLDNTGSCSIYAQRPLACRALLSTKPAEWCSVDFATLDPLEKRLYLESLEHPVVAYPVHYVACTQNAAEEAETRLQMLMETKLGTSISGNFPLLVYLSYTNNLVAQIKAGATNWPQKLRSSPFFHPLLLQLSPCMHDFNAPVKRTTSSGALLSGI
jgi:Fe-S-cluster containining protein